METLLAIIGGALFAAGIYMVLRRNLIKAVIGIILISNAVNVLFFNLGRLTKANPPLIWEGNTLPVSPFANPLPQALVLTAIVIGFGLLAFALVLAYRSYKELGTVDLDDMKMDPVEVSAEMRAEEEQVNQ